MKDSFITAYRLKNSYIESAKHTLYAIVKHKDSVYNGGHIFITTLYTDKECTQKLGELLPHCPRIAKSGAYKVSGYKDAVFIECVDNGVRRIETNKKLYKYLY
jgi:hypothetical protein